MLKVLKNLKESWISVIAIVILLIIQAAGDLTLPDYTSKIVNIGIQNGGIENVAPEVIRKSEMENLLIFTEEDDKILSSYEEISKENLDNKEYEKLVKKYPVLENEALYKFKKVNKNEQNELNSILAKPLMSISMLENEETSEQIKQQMLEQITKNQETQNIQTTENAQSTQSQQIAQAKIKEQQIQEMQNMSLIEIIKQMPKEQLEKMLENINQKINDMQESILEQAAIQEVKNEYKAIGIDTNQIQSHKNHYAFIILSIFIHIYDILFLVFNNFYSVNRHTKIQNSLKQNRNTNQDHHDLCCLKRPYQK